MAGAAPFRQIGIVGTGRVAAALGVALARQSASPIRLWGRDAGKADAAVAVIGRAEVLADIEAVARTCDLIVLAVSDDALAPCIAALATVSAIDGALAFHVSGRSGVALLTPLAAQGWRTAAIHPAMTFTGDPQAEVRRMHGASFAVTGSTEEARAQARALVERLGGIAVDVAEEARPLYHAALCHGANHLVTLISGACDALARAGVGEPAALLAPLVRAALENSLDKGMAGLSGPLLRGDVDTIGKHLTALRADCPALLPAYRAMGVATLDALASDHGPASGALRSLLENDA